MTDLNRELVDTLPTPLSDVYAAFKAESDGQPFRKVHRLIDLIEVCCKMYTAASIATFLLALRTRMEAGVNPMSEDSFTKIKVMLAAGLRTPSLGIWWLFAREISSVLKELQIPHILPGGEQELLDKQSLIFRAFDGENNLIAFRNKYAHGATPSDASCEKDLQEKVPQVLRMLEAAKSLHQVKLVICAHDGKLWDTKGGKFYPFEGNMQALPNHSWFCSDTREADIYPILTFKQHEEDGKVHFYFYNDLKEKQAGFLNYPRADHFKDSNLRAALLEQINIEEWRKISNVKMDPFRQLVEMLTEVFKGRKEALGKIAEFLGDSKSRYLCVWGAPGVGKSALLAQCSRIASNREWRIYSESVDGEINWPFGTVYLVDFFIRRGAKNKAIDFFDSVNSRLDVQFSLKLDLGTSDREKGDLFDQRLQTISKLLKDDQQLLLIIDGLDEIEHQDPLLSLLPKILPDKVKMIFGARPQPELRIDFYEQLDRERKTAFDLDGLSKEDTRAVLMEHVSKYELEQSYVEKVASASEGNPLYLKLLCMELEKNTASLNQITVLPAQMEDLYRSTLHHLEARSAGITQFLIYLAAAKDFVSPELLASWMEIETPQLRNKYLDKCLELLFENSLTENLEDYQLFHESLRGYLKDTYPSEYRKCEERISDWCFCWRLPGKVEPAFERDSLTYAMHFATDHLYESYQAHFKEKRKDAFENRSRQLFALVKEEKWRALNFEICGNGHVLGRSYQYVQRLLLQEDITGSRMQEFFQYAYHRHEEPARRYIEQRNELTRPVATKELPTHFERVPALAQMGARADDKVMLALLPLWVNRRAGHPIPAALEAQVSSWLETSRNTALIKLWKMSRAKSGSLQ